jgi:hypothetical protein
MPTAKIVSDNPVDSHVLELYVTPPPKRPNPSDDQMAPPKPSKKPRMPVLVNQNTHQGLRLANGASYTALEVILNQKYA